MSIGSSFDFEIKSVLFYSSISCSLLGRLPAVERKGKQGRHNCCEENDSSLIPKGFLYTVAFRCVFLGLPHAPILFKPSI